MGTCGAVKSRWWRAAEARLLAHRGAGFWFGQPELGQPGLGPVAKLELVAGDRVAGPTSIGIAG